jgi:N-methylhydantoinase A/oxoprolinase/acetone carboxylase beta subunit
MSTTLTTNTLVEGQGGRVALIYRFKSVICLACRFVKALKNPYVVLVSGHNRG